MPVYLKNKVLYEEVIRCQDASIVSPELIKMFYLISENLSYRMNFKYPEDRQDCVQSAVWDLYRYWTNFDRTRTKNAFSYMTQISKNGMFKFLREFRKISETKIVYMGSLKYLNI
jgi:DNA-directed RNA polymerase specialized sigma subunit